MPAILLGYFKNFCRNLKSDFVSILEVTVIILVLQMRKLGLKDIK